MRSFLEILVRGFFPDACRLCRRPLAWPDSGMGAGGMRPFFCPDCLQTLKPVSRPLCRICGLPLPASAGDHVCGPCLCSPPAFDMARAACLYEGNLVDIIHRFKYRGRTELARPLGRLMAQAFYDHGMRMPDAVLPVPMTEKRMRRRGFNQAGLLAAALVGEAGWEKQGGPLLDPRSLVRRHHDRSQTGLGRGEREANVRDAFAVARSPAGRHLLLVDDVFTTGATAGACARVLMRAGALSVSVLTAGRRA